MTLDEIVDAAWEVYLDARAKATTVEQMNELYRQYQEALDRAGIATTLGGYQWRDRVS